MDMSPANNRDCSVEVVADPRKQNMVEISTLQTKAPVLTDGAFRAFGTVLEHSERGCASNP